MKVAMLGASGAVGGAALARLVAMPEVDAVAVIVRRPMDGLPAKVAAHVCDVTKPETYASALAGADAAICTFGVSQPSKATRAEFRAIDFDAVLAFAKACKAQGIKHFELLGAVGAHAKSRSHYLESKGRLRDAIAALGFARFSCFQPSMILTPTNRYGWMQGVLLDFWPKLSPLLSGKARRYRGIRVESLGAAMAANLVTPGRGNEVLHWDDFMRLSADHPTLAR